MRPISRLLHSVLSTAPVALALAAFACGAVLAEHFRAEAYLSPRLGELVRVVPGSRAAAPRGSAVSVAASRLDGHGLAARETGEPCRFDWPTIQGAPGSLMVVGVEPGGGLLRVRWAGGATDPAADCGASAELRMDRAAFIILRNLADFGVPVLPTAAAP